MHSRPSFVTPTIASTRTHHQSKTRQGSAGCVTLSGRTAHTLPLSRPGSSSGRSRSGDHTYAPASKALGFKEQLEPVPFPRRIRKDLEQGMAEPVSPTPRKATRRGHRARKPGKGQASVIAGGEEEWEEVGDAGEEELLGLLGVSSPTPRAGLTAVTEPAEGSGALASRGGLLAVSKEDIEASSKRNTRRGKRHDPNHQPQASTGRADSSAAEISGGAYEKGALEDDTAGPAKELRSLRTPSKQEKRAGSRSRNALQLPTDSTTQSESDTPLPAASGSSTPKARQSRPKNDNRRSATKGMKQNEPVSVLSAQLAAHTSLAPAPSHPTVHAPSASSSSATTFELASMSRSLPTESFLAQRPNQHTHQYKPDYTGDGHAVVDEFGALPGPQGARKAKGRRKGAGTESEDESKVWDQPSDPGPAVAQDMTWQQRLGSYPNADSSRSSPSNTLTGSGSKKNKSRAAGSAVSGGAAGLPAGPSPLNPSVSSTAIPSTSKVQSRPTHARRSSADNLPFQGRHTSMPTQPGAPTRPKGISPAPPSAYPLSTFDTLPPFNPAQNVRRAPQTPAKGGLAAKYAVMELPLIGQFPRINGTAPGSGGMAVPAGGLGMAQQGSGEGGKYAGASFHNSPHGRALPKPDMDDF